MLSVILLSIPLLFMFIILLMNENNSRMIALIASGAALLFALFNYFNFSSGNTNNLSFDIAWVQSLGIHFNIGIDGISMVLILLTTLLYPFIIASSSYSEIKKPKAFYSLILLMQFGLLGVFMAKDAFLFYVFYEVTLIPVYFICAIWGGERSVPITLKFFIYTLAGSLFMLIAIIYLYFKTPQAHTFDLQTFYHLQLSATEQAWIFWAFFLAFAIKIPVFPFHTWQPATYTVSPVSGTMLLAGIMLKMGIYGIIRFILPITPMAIAEWGNVAIVLCIIGIVYASLIALRQNDLKTLIAYSSISHVGLIAAGVLSVNSSGLQGAMIQMFSHGVNVVAMFFMIDIIERRYGTRWMDNLGCVAGQMKTFSWLFIIVLLGSVGLPLTNGFVGEFLLLNGLYDHNAWYAAVAGLSLILGAAYMLRLYRNVFLGEAKNFEMDGGDISFNEKLILIPLCVLVIVIGVYPSLLLNISQNSVDAVLQIFHHGAITAASN